MKKKLALALLIGLSFFVLPQQVSANEIPPSLTYESLDKTTIRLFIQNSNSNREHRICPSILNKQNLDGSWSCHEALKLYSGQGLTYDYKLSYGNTDGFNVNSYDISTKQWSGWSVWHHFTNTNPNEPIVVLPTTTTVPTTIPAIIPTYSSGAIIPTYSSGAYYPPITIPKLFTGNYSSPLGINPAAPIIFPPVYKYPPIDLGFSSGCVGICYGVPSQVNGLARNTYVSGYFRSNGTWVNPYTRSKP